MKSIEMDPTARKDSDASLRAALRDMPLRYRLSIPFLFLALFGTVSLVFLAIRSQNDLIQRQEIERLNGYDRAFEHKIDRQGRWAVSLASSFARNPEISEALAKKDRLRLIELCYDSFTFMKAHYGISQFNFHTLPPRMFLRLQRLYEFGDSLDYRQSILDAISTQSETFGLELGLTGYGIRGVAPVLHQGQMVGTTEIGFNFGRMLLKEMKEQFGIEATFLLPREDGTGFKVYATTFTDAFDRADPAYPRVFEKGIPEILIQRIADRPFAVWLRAVRDYEGRTVGLLELCVDRAGTLAITAHYRRIMVGIGLLGLIFSVGAIYVISLYFSKPIGKMVSFAREVASGAHVHPSGLRPSGELGVLAEALDEMLLSLEESRGKIQEYAENLEQMVHLRTRALRESEEKYRTLVESVPLVVYRLISSGRVIFINHYVEDLVGVSAREAMEDPSFWKRKVLEDDRERVWPLMERCLQEGSEFKAEYRITHANGKSIFVLDHAIPVLDEKGQVEIVDGFLVNVTDRHRLQQQILQTEELKTLTEISARLGHEIRNPLVAAGGFARRLLENLPAGDSNREKVQIIVQEVARLEKILEKTLAYLRPFEVSLEKGSLNDLLIQVLEEHKDSFTERSIVCGLNLSLSLPFIPLDKTLFKKALGSTIQAMIGHCPSTGKLEVQTYPGESLVHLDMTLKGAVVSPDDIEHFFYPFTTRLEPSRAIDLPLAKMVIHKHRGVLQLRRKEPDLLLLSLSLPQ
jgi:PAS domain S-box-containing protein